MSKAGFASEHVEWWKLLVGLIWVILRGNRQACMRIRQWFFHVLGQRVLASMCVVREAFWMPLGNCYTITWAFLRALLKAFLWRIYENLRFTVGRKLSLEN